MKIQPIVEGYGEVAALPVLIRRLRDAAAAFEVDVRPPIRRNRSDLSNEARLRLSVRLALAQPDCDAILIVLDADDDCPKEVGPRLQAWAESEAAGCPCAVVLAKREYEAWFLAAIESLRGWRGIRTDAIDHPNPESPRNAKGQLSDRMGPGRTYSPSVDQAALTAAFELSKAYGRCRSFRKLTRAFGRLLVAHGLGPEEWPPASWSESSP